MDPSQTDNWTEDLRNSISRDRAGQMLAQACSPLVALYLSACGHDGDSKRALSKNQKRQHERNLQKTRSYQEPVENHAKQIDAVLSLIEEMAEQRQHGQRVLPGSAPPCADCLPRMQGERPSVALRAGKAASLEVVKKKSNTTTRPEQTKMRKQDYVYVQGERKKRRTERRLRSFAQRLNSQCLRHQLR